MNNEEQEIFFDDRICTRNDFFHGLYVAKSKEGKYLRRAAAGGSVGEVVARKLLDSGRR